jgi:chemotaxis signal transduction protein
MRAGRADGEQVHVLVFVLGRQRYGVDVEQLVAVVEGEPCNGSWCYEGQEVPVQSLACWIGLDQAGEPPSRVLVSRSGGALHGFLVDTPEDIVTLPVDQIFPVPALIQQVLGPSPLWGIGRFPGGLLLLVDLVRAEIETHPG